MATFCSQTVELTIKLPLETVLRRGQVDVALSNPHSEPIDTVIDVGMYKGLFGTVRTIVYEEGERAAKEPALPNGGKGTSAVSVNRASEQRRRGQGPNGLYRGWRVGMWGLVGVWGAATLGGIGTKGGEF